MWYSVDPISIDSEVYHTAFVLSLNFKDLDRCDHVQGKRGGAATSIVGLSFVTFILIINSS